MTPIERAARALATQLGGTCRSGEAIETIEDLRNTEIDIGSVDLIKATCAVLQAIREPSDAMVHAAVMSTVEIWNDERDAEREFKTEFAAAIDAAMEEGQ